MASVTKTIEAANTWSDAIGPNKSKSEGIPGKFGHLACSVVIPDGASTVTLQRSFDGGSNWVDVDTFTASMESSLYDPTVDVQYRIGVATSDYDTSSPSEVVEVGLYQ